MTDKPWPGTEIIRAALRCAKSASEAFSEAYDMAREDGLNDLEAASIGRTASREFLIRKIEGAEGDR